MFTSRAYTLGMDTGARHIPRLILRQPNTVFIRLGALAASSIPMSFGAWLLLPYINYFKWGCKAGSATGKCLEYWPTDPEPYLWAYPAGLTCLIFTPIVCWICCRYVRREIADASLTFNALAGFTTRTTILWQLIAGALHLLTIFIADWPYRFDLDLINSMIQMILLSLLIHFFIFLFVTLPLCIASFSTFRIIALKVEK